MPMEDYTFMPVVTGPDVSPHEILDSWTSQESIPIFSQCAQSQEHWSMSPRMVNSPTMVSCLPRTSMVQTGSPSLRLSPEPISCAQHSQHEWPKTGHVNSGSSATRRTTTSQSKTSTTPCYSAKTRVSGC